jgi:hypothetical protein
LLMADFLLFIAVFLQLVESRYFESQIMTRKVRDYRTYI